MSDGGGEVDDDGADEVENRDNELFFEREKEIEEKKKRSAPDIGVA